MPGELLTGLDELVPQRHVSRAEAIRSAVEVYLCRVACERDAQRYAEHPFTDEELTLADAPETWSHTSQW